ncbi:MAG TPA: hypothetical protein VLF39_03665 [Candidatus Saccharimonadales bacterium]|nr:hypothetical protein [Candidatus Saccharimonadales bacterium]
MPPENNQQTTDSPAPAPSPVTPQTQTSPPTEPSKPTKGYGKRPIWQWVLIYVVLAIIVYGLIYFIFIHKSGTAKGYGY